MSAPIKDTRNIAILAHVDAGKTTVSERLLYFSESIPGLGEVDEGLATMDYLEEEKKRGITIEAGIAAYSWKGTRVTFVDTPGHVDFGVEVDFALQAVEGVVLVLSGISGIESQSLEAWEKIRANKNRALIFINKLDISGSDYRKVMEQIQVMFKVHPVALTIPVYIDGKIDGVVDVLNQLALYRSVDNPRKLIKGEIPAFLAEEYGKARKDLIDVASQFNDSVLTAYLNGEEIKNEDIVSGLTQAMIHGGNIPVYMGSALKNVGVRQLMNGINLMNSPPEIRQELASSLGFIIKIRYYQTIGKIFLAKIYNADSLASLGDAQFFRVFAESLEEIKDPRTVKSGDIIAIKSTHHFRMGQFLLTDGKLDSALAPGAFLKKYRPLLQSRIELVHADDFAYVDQTLKQLADTEPSISIAPDNVTGGWQISTVGELQLDVFCKRLKKDHKCDIKIGAPTVRYLEKLKSSQIGIENASTAGKMEVRIIADFLPKHEEEQNHLSYLCGKVPEEYLQVFEATFELFCSQGSCGFGNVAGLECRIQKIVSTGDPAPLPLLSKCFSDLLKLNLSCAQFDVFEPIMRLEIIIPDEFCGSVLADLAGRGGIVRKMDSDGYNSIILLEIPLSNTFGYTTLLRSLSKGLGVYVLTYEKHGARR